MVFDEVPEAIYQQLKLFNILQVPWLESVLPMETPVSKRPNECDGDYKNGEVDVKWHLLVNI
jgi:hypothetical protein